MIETTPPLHPDTVLSLTHISKNFGSFRALDNVSFSVRRSSICALIGANGAGKTTLIRIATGLIPPDSGTVASPYILEKPGQAWFSYLPEDSGLYDRMRVEDTIIYFARLSGLSRRQAQQDLPVWLARFGIEAKKRARVQELSKGNHQKVKLICALINRPPVLILDEPFNGLDGETSVMLRRCLTELRGEGATILVSSHRLDQMDLLADHLVVIAAGRKILDDTLKGARLHYRQNRPAAHLLDSLPGVIDLSWSDDVVILALGPAANPRHILQELLTRGCEVENFLRHSPDLSEIVSTLYSRPQNGGVE
jgi:ABC-2 type transport system ATP-binding protein